MWQVNLTGMPHGLSFQETKELWVRADLDGDGVFNYEELKVNYYKPVGLKPKCQIHKQPQ